ncbi:MULTISPECIES: ABC transporter permease [unclassified Janthinobacterium]|uniref:ABC transporter permease n=1 Tax=unclassified Janthinobacterium TaxID=2610881 RepID=UPI00034D8620|nr:MULTISPECIES: ribose ABC transporter permease [unclassified Janthinobacterium]MEC5159631.1 ribose transport system permease protein [Janthinobacterium sp. CG_S6]
MQQPVNTNTPPAAPAPAAALWRALGKQAAFLPFAGLLLVCAVMIATTEHFLSLDNLVNIARQVSINAIIAVGMSCAIISGGIDLSVGSVMALTGTLSAGLMVAGVPPAAAIPIGLAVGVAFGVGNGFFVAYAKMPPIIVTLATMGIARGMALLYTGGYPINDLPAWFEFFGKGSVLGVQAPILTMLLVFALAYVLLEHTPPGRYIYAIGGNEEATRLSGVRVARYKLLVYAISGFTAAIAGLVLTSRLMSGQPNAGVGFELDAIAAVVMGGTAITGGRGSIVGTLIGALMLGVLNNGLNMMGVSPYLQNIIKGVIILLAIYISRNNGKRG